MGLGPTVKGAGGPGSCGGGEQAHPALRGAGQSVDVSIPSCTNVDVGRLSFESI